MKKQLILFLVLLINLSSVYARSITFRIINNSNTTFLRSKVEDNPEKGYCNLTMPDQNLLQWDHLEPGRECVVLHIHGEFAPSAHAADHGAGRHADRNGPGHRGSIHRARL